jgi:O-antigen ligase
MKGFLKFTEQYNERLYFLSLCLIIISFPFSIALNSIALGIILFFFFIDYKNIIPKCQYYISQRRNILLLVLFTSLFASLAYTQNTDKGIAKVIGYLPFIALPLGMTKLKPVPSKQMTMLKRLHIITCVLASIICLVLATIDSGLLDGSYVGKVAPNLYTAYFVHRFTYHKLSEQINLHAIYFSLFIATAQIFCIQEIITAKRHQKFLFVLTLCFLGAILFLLKSVVINFAIYSFLLLYLFYRFSFQKKIHYILFFLLVFMAAGINFYLFILKEVGSFAQNTYLFEDPNWNKRFLIALASSLTIAFVAVAFKKWISLKRSTVFIAFLAIGSTLFINKACQMSAQELYIEKEKGSGVNNVSARAGSWAGALLIVKEHPWLGIGIGDTEAALIEKYKKINFVTGVQNQFNAHNQYLEFWIGSGIVAILCFVLLIFSEGYDAYINRNVVLLGLLYIFLISCFTESVINRQAGRIFFIFFLCLLSNNHKTLLHRAINDGHI